MKTKSGRQSRVQNRGSIGLQLYVAEPLEERVLLAGQPFVTSVQTNGQYNGTGRIGAFSTTGATVNDSLVPSFYPVGLAVSGSDLFVVNNGDVSNVASTGTINEYTTSGKAVNAPLVSKLSNPTAIAVSGPDLFVVKSGTTIGEYTTSGNTVKASLISKLSNVGGIAVSGSDLFVTNGSAISEYTTAGKVVNASLVTGLNGPGGIAISGSDLFVLNKNSGTIGEYTTSGEEKGDKYIFRRRKRG